ncbi:MAG: hypothetical protein M3298_07295, partial [Thermoproteota archaeon]|nr:hypothetical protein [Thermoproteota archaeon]
MIIPRVFFVTFVAAILIFSMTGISYQQVELLFDDEGIEEEDGAEEDGAEEDGAEEDGAPCID